MNTSKESSNMINSFWFLPRFLFIAFLSGATLGMSKIMLTLFAVSIGISTSQLGIVNGIEGVAIACMTLPAGAIVVRYGARRVYVIASLLAAICYSMLPHSNSWTQLAFLVSLCAICSAFRIVSMSGAFMELLPKLGAGKAGWFRAALMSGLVLVGPVGGTSLIHWLGNIQAYYFVGAGFLIMAIAGPSVLPSLHISRPSRSFYNEIIGLTDILRNSILLRICTIEMAISMILSYFSVFIVLIAVKELDWTSSEAVALIVLEGVTSIVTMVVAGQMLRDAKPRRLFTNSTVSLVIGLLILSQAKTFAGFSIGVMLMAFGLGIAHVMNVRVLSGIALDKSRAASLQTMAQTVGMGFGALAGGLAAQILSMQGVFLLGGILYGVVAVVALAMRRKPVQDFASKDQAMSLQAEGAVDL